jgi:hypothetical protein
MINFSFSGVFKFLTGILLVQIATGMLVVVALRSDHPEIWLLCGLLALTLGLLTVFWFSSITSQVKKEVRAQIREEFSREREKIRVRAEREKSKLMEKSHQRIIKERSRTRTQANLKSGALLTGVLGLGGILIFTQFFTVGLLLMMTAGGALAGYLMRSRQLLPGRNKKLTADRARAEKQIPNQVAGNNIKHIIDR